MKYIAIINTDEPLTEHAIQAIKDSIFLGDEQAPYAFEIEDIKYKSEAVDMAIKALEQEPRKGHWIEYSWNDNGLARWGLECDKCHKKYKYGGEIWNNPNFCPNCGAKMESEDV